MKRNLQLDILRGIAILLVFGPHLDIKPPAGLLGEFYSLWYSQGPFGVYLFFILSGFLIGGLLFSELKKHGTVNVTHFLIRRGFKIYPGYYLFIAYLFIVPLLRGKNFDYLLSSYIPYITFTQNYIGTDIAGHLWSLAVEEHFYLILPFVFLLLKSQERIRLMVIICLSAPLIFTFVRIISIETYDPYIWNINRTMAATHLTIDALLLGVGIRGLSEFYPTAFLKLKRLRYIFMVLGLAILFLQKITIYGLPINRIFPVWTLAAVSIFLCIYNIHRDDFGRAYGFIKYPASILSFIGVFSYSIYLWHVTSFGIIEKYIIAKLPVFGGVQFHYLICVFITCLGGILAGVVFSKIVEYPTLRIRDRLFPSRS